MQLKVTLPGLILLMGCATPGSQLPASFRGPHEVIQLAATGRIFIEQKFRPAKNRCRTATVDLATTVRGRQGRVALEVTCDETTGKFLGTTAFLPPGDYSLSLARNRRLYSSGPAVVSVLYRNADFESGDDGNFETALELEPGQKLEGAVHYHAGDRTDWIRMKGEKASVGLVFTAPEGSKLEAEAFSAMPGNSGVRRLGALPIGEPRRFPLGSDDLLIRVRAPERSGGASYSLVRRDTEGKKASRVQVIDCYPTGSGMGLAILRVSAGIAVNDSVVISASDSNGKRQTLGKCTVLSVDGPEASCQLPYSDQTDWVDFRADGVYQSKGGSA